MASAPTFTLRPASRDDFAYLYALHVLTMKAYVTATWGWDDAVQERMFRHNFDPARVQVVVSGGEDCGALVVERRADAVFLAAIEVHPSHQGRGLGTEILRTILADAGGLPVELRVLKVNPARGLYERLGFVVTAETTTHYFMRTG